MTLRGLNKYLTTYNNLKINLLDGFVCTSFTNSENSYSN